MAGRYVPPALRRQQQQAGAVSKPDDDAAELPKRRLEDLRISHPRSDDGYRADEIHTFFGGPEYCESTRSTLNNSIDRPDKLAYVMLFRNANPRWKSDKIIFAKSNISYLPGYGKAFKGVQDPPSHVENEAPTGEGLDKSLTTESAQQDIGSKEATSDQDDSKEVGSNAADSNEADPKERDPIQADSKEAVPNLPDLKETDPNGADPKEPEPEEIDFEEANKNPTVGSPSKLSPDAALPASAPLDLAPIAVFEQCNGRGSTVHATFVFRGWFNLGRVDFLKPRSKEVIKMLSQKWSLTDRRGHKVDAQREKEAWDRSTSLRWSVIQLARMAEQPAAPDVPRSEFRPRRQPSAEWHEADDCAEIMKADGGLKVLHSGGQ